ncbi:hypothetical protein TMatcc_001188 [Talaromyces marneffei ATCC 18224]|uniref:Endo-1,4-beta-xylanase n=1 Tax=Talaromyces marneffei (strain ATCC 18224 / CBS 334.59 / QM 7333) TaxID=441960 RepID=B6QNW0_TALMQ|nr:endo-1,4-beta-xylanase, putative [Talaromyces marneffei ATCC 18224]
MKLSLAVAGLCVTSAFAFPSKLPQHAGADLSKRQSITTSQTGINGGYYYSFWTNGGGEITYTNGANGEYSVKIVTYSGEFDPTGNAYLAVYGWTADPLVEHYILESYGTYNQSSGLTSLGQVTTDGGTYDSYSIQRYWSVRTEKRVGGTITTVNHFAAWKALGLEMGTYNYMIVSTEGYESSGSSTITVS